jgi:glycosyltransferase involved in cell wall biosynthesis
MPGLLWQAYKLIRQADVVNLHLPQMDGAPLAVLSRCMGKPVVMTYICDLRLPPGAINWLANQVSGVANQIAGSAVNLITAMSQDYANHSPFLRRNRRKVVAVDAPVALPPVTSADVEAFRARWNILPDQPIIGMVARLAAEKGVEYLVEALPLILSKYPQARVIYVGQHQNVLGEEQYAQRLAPMIEQLGNHWTFVGTVSYPELAAFYQACSVTVLPSLNSTEAFGMVQVESIISGTPVVSTDLPGVRVPVQSTGMGIIVPPRDARALAEAVTEILDHKEKYLKDAAELRRRFATQTAAAAYEALFRKVINHP